MPRKKQSGPVMGLRQYKFLAKVVENLPGMGPYPFEDVVMHLGKAMEADNPRFKLAVWRYEAGLDHEAPAGWRVAGTSNEED